MEPSTYLLNDLLNDFGDFTGKGGESPSSSKEPIMHLENQKIKHPQTHSLDLIKEFWIHQENKNEENGHQRCGKPE